MTMNETRRRQMACTCWVSRATAEIRFGARWGAHNLRCLAYRVSLDPVDKLKDVHNRLGGEREFGKEVGG